MREVVRKLRAFEQIGPLPRYSTKHLGVSSNSMIVAFVRMSGETRPWGVAYGPPGSDPRLVSVADGRDRDDIAEMLTPFAESLLSHFRCEGFTFDPITKTNLPIESPPQLWVPGSSHLDMLHFISYGYWKRRKDDDLRSPLSAMSRLCVWIFSESKVQGQQMIVDTTKELTNCFVYPVDEHSTSNIANALAWHNAPGSYLYKLKSTQKHALKSVGITLDLEVEQGIEPELEKYRASVKAGSPEEGLANSIKSRVEFELLRRWKLAEAGRSQIAQDSRPTNSGTASLLTDSLTRYFYDFQRLERQMSDPEHGPAFTPHPETENHGTAAASRYFRLNAASAKYLPSLIHEDPELFRESLAKGQALEGTVFQVKVESVGQASEIYWILRATLSDEFRIRAGEYLSLLGSPGHYVSVEELEFLDFDVAQLTLKFLGRKTLRTSAPISETPRSEKWLMQNVVFVPRDSSDLDTRASFKVWKTREAPGAWLTHSGPTFSPVPGVVDDVSQLESRQ